MLFVLAVIRYRKASSYNPIPNGLFDSPCLQKIRRNVPEEQRLCLCTELDLPIVLHLDIERRNFVDI